MPWEDIGFQCVEGEGFYAVGRMEAGLPADTEEAYITRFQQKHTKEYGAPVDPERDLRVTRSEYLGLLTIMSPVVQVPPEITTFFARTQEPQL